MATEVLLPKLGLTMTEGTILEVLVGNGTVIAVGDPIITVATDKVDVDIEAEAAGSFHAAIDTGVTLAPGALLAWLLEPGETVPDGGATPVATDGPTPAPLEVAEPDAAPPAPKALAGGRLLASPNAKRVAADLEIDLTTVHGTGPGGRIVSEDVEEGAAKPAPVVAASIPVISTAAAGGVTAMDLRPPLRKLARSLGVEVATIVGTGPGGSVVRADVLAAFDPQVDREIAVVSSTPTKFGQNAVTKVVPLTGMRGAIASRMHASLQESAQLTHGYHVALDAVVALRAQLKAESRDGDLVPSINDFVVMAVAQALVTHPGMNASIADGEVRHLRDIHVGLAVAVPDGLYVPVIRFADQLSLLEITEETRRLATVARSGKLTLDQLEGGTFAVTSLGTYGVDFFTPVINLGNVGILGVGQMRDGVRWEGERPERTHEVTLSLTFDHRAVDGAPAAEFLRTLDDLLSRPLRLVLS
ncbi:MAG: 2-oxo acid dehydrogenase subunit E2 [Flavobacterium sp.]|nr:2-oxo acid dehydrogenase subunit E2 [Aeromicrobium sp.]